MADLRHLDRRTGRRRAAELLDRFDLADAARQTVATYSGGMRRRLDLAMTLVGAAAADLPRRADHRARPAQPPHDVADHPRARRRRRHDPADHPVPRRGRRARRPHRRPRPRPHRRRGHSRRAQAARSPAATPASRFPTRTASTQPRALIGASSRDDDALVLRVPTDDTPDALRDLLERLDDDGPVERLTVHTPDLDDVFLALTGGARPTNRRQP